MSSESSESFPANPVPPRRPPYPPPPATPRGFGLLGCLFALSMLCNVAAGAVMVLGCLGALAFVARSGDGVSSVTEHLHSGMEAAVDKIAVVHLDGVIMEGALEFVHKQLEKAASDKNVKAVVLRINSPGGSITASDDLHHRLLELRNGNPDKKFPAKPLVISMASLAASGGYYVAMPGQPIFAERTTITGSIGVYASFPNITELSKKAGFGMHTIKQGAIKDSGSPFKTMSGEEEQVWQDLVDTAYQQFVGVVETGRPKLKGKLLESITIHPVQAGPPAKDKVKVADYKRYRADGGVFTADKALEFGLVDQLGFLDDAIQDAKKQAGLDEYYKAVDYQKPKTVFDLLSGKAPAPSVLSGRLQNGLIPRLWYLAPGCELSGLVAATAAD